ncbi:hypothetical protein FNV43_RR06872 [Rhamnella rubrinervis]|uniref:RanBD1 domain-containing protein n=1 Tax=Rhamnella rubrinervis TaxID=2594499 RepID=A0A8K0HER0_9ROSA|nr:hypothetical protein FNV43_RR06872 [Rhamnella rubrinervis]
MGDAENALPPSKKRAAGREISRDNPGLDDEEDTSEQEAGTFKRASDEVLATRRIVKVRRPQPTPTPSSNPFAGIRLVPTTGSDETQSEVRTEAQPVGEKTSSGDVDGKTKSSEEKEKGKGEDNKQSESSINETVTESAADEKEESAADEKEESAADEKKESAADEKKESNADEKQAPEEEKSDISSEAAKPVADNEPAEGEEKTEEKTENADSNAESTRLSSFQQLSSSQNAFTNLSGTGFSTSTFSFGSIAKDGSALGTGSGSIFGPKNDQPFGLGLSANGNSSLFGTPGASIVSKSEGSSFPPMHEVAVETGEENEEVVFSADSVLFEFIDGGWKERGKGELKVNVSTTGTEKARLVMRAKGNYRLILNASIYPDMKLTNMEKKGITFACINSTGEGTGGFSTFALKFKDGSIVEKFRMVVTENKGKTPAVPAVLKTPENSPKASDE